MTLNAGPQQYAGNPLTNKWSYFTITVVNPCDEADPCDFTTVIAPTDVLSDMTAYFDFVLKQQAFTQFSDTVTQLCPGIQCQGYEISLVYVSDGSTVPADLAKVALSKEVRVQTKNYAYAGTHTVRIKCIIKQGAAVISTGYSDTFDIILDPCNLKSCVYSELIAKTAADTQPQSYSIGVDNV